MTAPGGRMQRVDEAMREVIASVLSGELSDPRLGFVTVTEVRTSPDLRHARVFVSVLGEPAEAEATLEGLASAAGLLQAQIAGELRLKRTPALRFELDDTAQRAARLEDLITSESEAGS